MLKHIGESQYAVCLFCDKDCPGALVFREERRDEDQFFAVCWECLHKFLPTFQREIVVNET